jgi:D-Tyr-tRNAtyr deacylase
MDASGLNALLGVCIDKDKFEEFKKVSEKIVEKNIFWCRIDDEIVEKLKDKDDKYIECLINKRIAAMDASGLNALLGVCIDKDEFEWFKKVVEKMKDNGPWYKIDKGIVNKLTNEYKKYEKYIRYLIGEGKEAMNEEGLNALRDVLIRHNRKIQKEQNLKGNARGL